MTHATQLAVFALWVSAPSIYTTLPTCPRCLALCEMAMVEHDARLDNFPPDN